MIEGETKQLFSLAQNHEKARNKNDTSDWEPTKYDHRRPERGN